jgi:SulP family sulfate permease
MDLLFFMSQLEFKTMANGESVWLSEPLFIMLGLVLLTIAIVLFFLKITKAVPASLVAMSWSLDWF